MAALDLSDKPVRYPIDNINQSFADRFQTIVERCNDRLAVRTPETSLSYSQLNERANVIASAILASGSKDKPIAILLRNDEQMICSQFAVWKLNRIVVALDAGYPQSRLESILEDSTTNLLVTNSSLLDVARKVCCYSCEILNLDAIEESPDAGGNILVSDDGSSGAIIQYTSGTTGKPKGILHSHRNWLHGVSTGTISYLDISSDDRYALLHSCSFSAGTGDTLNALLHGASLWIWDLRERGTEGLVSWLNDSRITLFNQSPSLFRHLSKDFVNGARVDSIRAIILGSEPVTRTDFDIFRNFFSDDCVFINRLGCTEALGYHLTILHKNSRIDDEVIATDILVRDQKMRIVDEYGKTVSRGQVGEILIESEYLAIEYWNYPDETSKRFKTNSETGSRYFMTGDLGCLDDDGVLCFKGRSDFQVQIRGHRVEVAEVENALNELPEVDDSAVIAYEREPGEASLRAFYVGDTKLLEETIRKYLRRLLPDYMVPSIISRLDSLPKTPSGKLDRLALENGLSLRADRNQSLIEGSKDSLISQSLAQRFQKMTQSYRSRVAVKTPDLSLTYEELNRLANTIASLLAALSSGTKPIAILLGNNERMIGSMLAVWKLNRIVVPLDPGYPEKRLDYILQDSTADILIVDSQTSALVPAGLSNACKVLDLASIKDSVDEEILISDDGNSGAILQYTSGTTGNPKGILHSHRNWLHNILRGSYTFLDIGSEDRITLLHSCSFSSGTVDILNALLNGSTLCIWDIKKRGTSGLVEWLRDSNVTIFNQSPSLFRHLVEDFEQGISLDTLRAVILGSETVTKIDFEIYRKYFSDRCRFINRLGCTEALSYHLGSYGKDLKISDHVIPTSIDVDGRLVRIVDQTGNQVASGVMGEIQIHSDFLALEYWGLPEASASKFKIDSRTGSRYFITGDLGCVDGHGNLHFKGRRDFQVQVRGHRVEVAEIENILNEFDEIRDCAVVAFQEEGLETRLLAFYESEGLLEERSLKDRLRHALPDYMIPVSINRLEGLPRSPNGKLDRKALSGSMSPKLESLEIEKSSQTEQDLVEIWMSALKLSDIRSTDNFFDLGGHSILAFKTISLVNRKFGVLLSVREFYSASTLHELAVCIDDKKTKTPSVVVINDPIQEQQDVRIPASFSQKRLWLSHQIEKTSQHYHLPQAFSLQGAIDIDALKIAFREILERHEALRTICIQDVGQLYQEVRNFNEDVLGVIDLCDLPEAERREKANRLVEDDMRRPFDLECEPMLRALLIKMDEKGSILYWCIHHISADGWSLMLFLRDLTRIYAANDGNRVWENSMTSYADFSKGQFHLLQSPELKRQLKFWEGELDKAPRLLELPTDKPRPAQQTFAGSVLRVTVPTNEYEEIKNRCSQDRTTLFIFLMTCYQVLLHRFSGQADIVVGTPVAGRFNEDLENTIGFFANTLAFRCRFTDPMAFSSLLEQVRDKAIEVFDNQQAPFEAVVERINPKRNLGFSPIFQVMFALQNAPKAELELGGSKVERIPLDLGASKFDLTLNVDENDESLSYNLEYNTDLFNVSTAERLVACFSKLAISFARNPSLEVNKVSLVDLCEVESGHSLEGYDAFGVEAGLRAHELFENQAKKTPDSVALEFEEISLSYAELNNRADVLSYLIRKLLFKNTAGIGIYLPRSIDMVVALLASLKANCYFVPMDPSFPQERLRMMREDAGIDCVITNSRLEEDLQDVAHRILIDQLDFDSSSVKSSPLADPSEKNLAYVIFTSGSTGRPKGVAVPHEALTNLLLSMQRELGIEKNDTLIAITTFSFDISILEILLPLISGAKLVVLDKESASDGRTLLRKIESVGATIMQGTPSTWQLLLSAGWEGLPKMKVLCGGEAMSKGVRSGLLNTGCEIWNLYGPTETTIWSAVERIAKEHSETTIGHPIANTELFVLNNSLRIQPIGVWGELYIGGKGLAREYVGRPDLTEAAFIPHPFREGERLYKTGDRVRRLEAHRIQYDGRLDNQVKVRGFRIELAEIEACLDRHDHISRSVVLAIGDDSNESRLVAYYQKEPGVELDKAELRSHASATLPSYMVPNLWIPIESFPLTPNGKIDRKSLGEMVLEESSVEKSVAPRSELERDLLKLWRKVLDRKNVSIVDDFFEAGGHSLLAAQLFGEMEKRLSISLPLAVLFKAPTIEKLANFIQSEDRSHAWSSLVPIKDGGRQAPLFLVHGAEGNVLLYRDLAHSLDDERPVFGLQSSGLDGQSKIAGSVEEMAADYIEEIKGVQSQGPYFLAGYCLGGTIAFEMARRLEESGDQVAFLGLLETYNIQAIRSERKAYRKFANLLLNVYFHIENMLSLPVSSQMKFFAGKLRVEWARFRIRRSVFLRKFSWKKRFGDELAYVYLRLKASNDKAQIDYKPTLYRGPITLFKPRKTYLGLEDKYYGWKQVSVNKIRLRELSMAPRALLTPPFSDELGTMLSVELKRSISENVC